VELDGDLALEAARLGVELKLPLADSVVLATTRAHGATSWTQDEDFDGIAGVRYVREAEVAKPLEASRCLAASGLRRGALAREGDHRRDPDGAPRRDRGGQRRDNHEQRGDREDGQRVAR
jgi:hypothetical protein